MKIPFELPPVNKDGSRPIWTGNGFMVDGQFKTVLKYSSNVSGWVDDLTHFHESTTGSDHWIDIASRQYTIMQLEQHVKKKSPVILEIGCSSGYMLKAIQKSFPKALILGVDCISGPLNELSKEFRGIPLLQFDLVRCPLPDMSVDTLVLLNVLEHIQHDSVALFQLNRILKPGGVLILEVPAGPSLYDVYDEYLLHYRRYGFTGLRNLVCGAGFSIIRASHLGFFLYPMFVLAKKRNQHFFNSESGNKRKVVEESINRTRSNLLFKFILNVEIRLGRYVSYPFGIRCLMTCKKFG